MKEKIFVSTDPVIFSLQKDELYVLLQKHKNLYRLPGGLIDTEREINLDNSAYNNLYDKTSLSSDYFEQLKTYGGQNRDSRSNWTISVAYIGIVNNPENAINSIWIKESELNQLTFDFDHQNIINDALKRLKDKVNYSILPAYFLPKEFTMRELKNIYEIILNEKIDKSSFIKKINDTNSIEAIEGQMRTGNFRPAQLYRIKKLTNFNKNLKLK